MQIPVEKLCKQMEITQKLLKLESGTTVMEENNYHTNKIANFTHKKEKPLHKMLTRSNSMHYMAEKETR